MYAWIDKIEKEILLEMLGDLMSNISEECYSSGWQEGTEYIVPALCIKANNLGRREPWAHGEITPEMAELLLTLANKVGGWASYDEVIDGYKIINPFPTPSKYSEEIKIWETKKTNEHIK